jgi:diaminohydroxyphosphoribosylaminopyrimidine deaminase/5-amino-6-(5-phosphoribosylamino)uracil reductase
MQDEAVRLNEDFFWYILHKKPFVAAKLALTLDNKIADSYGKSKWITGEESLEYSHFLRSVYSSIAVGKNTLSADDPQLTARLVENAKNPVRIVFSSNKMVGKNSFFRKNAENHRSIIVVSGKEKYREIDGDGVEIWATGQSDYVDSFLSFLEIAGKEEIDSVLLEGGSKLIATALKSQSVNRMFLFYAPKILGAGTDGLFLNDSLSLSNPIKLKGIETQKLGDDILLSGIVEYP